MAATLVVASLLSSRPSATVVPRLLVQVAVFGCPRDVRCGLHELLSPDFLELRLLLRHANSARVGFKSEVSLGPWVSSYFHAQPCVPFGVRIF